MPRHIETNGDLKFGAYYWMLWSWKEAKYEKFHSNLELWWGGYRKTALTLAT